MPPDPVQLLRRHMGYPGFRPGQEELVRAALAGRDALGILPTGGGKSVCYQVPALALEGLTLVITPLISLMEDQVQRAGEVGLRAAHLSAVQPAAERRSIRRAAAEGALDVLFVSPERLELAAFRELAAGAGVALLAVDEAHCISQWGHDFRPAYRRIAEVRPGLGAPVLALTATATPRVREDITANLRLHQPAVVVRSFDRPNLSWQVVKAGDHHQRVRRLYRLLRRVPGTAIVYAPTRRTVDATRDALAGFGVRTEAYHAGLPGEERSRVQEAFMGDACRVVVATNAFGMGIDKPDVRLVAHLQLPGTLEAYYQEAGRAGRDGAPAECVAFHHRHDRRLARRFIDRTHPPGRELRRLHALLRRRADARGVAEIDAASLARAMGRGALPEGVEAAVAALIRAGALRPLSGDGKCQQAASQGTGSHPSASEALRMGVRARAELAGAALLRRAALARLDAVHGYARARGCRRRALLRYFGEEAPRQCGACDRCRPPSRD